MDQSTFDYLYEAGRLHSTVFQIGVRADPSLDNTQSFAAVLFFELGDGTVVEVAKVDNSEHDEGTIHIDRYYREVGAVIKDFDIDVSDIYEADRRLDAKWRRFGRTYLDNHGRQPRNE